MTIDRRSFIAGAAATPLAAPGAWAQQQRGKLKRLAFVSGPFPIERISESGEPSYAAFLQELRRLGWIEGQTLQVERATLLGRTTGEQEELTRQIVASRPDLIVVGPSFAAARFKAATADIPIVFAGASNPIGAGIAQSLARPGGNVTGFASDTGPELDQKRAQLLHDAVPLARRIAYLATPTLLQQVAETYGDAANRLGLTLIPIVLERPVDEGWLRRGFASLAEEGAQAVILSSVTALQAYPQVIADLALAARLPAVTSYRELTEAGVLMYYGPDFMDLWRKAAGYVDRIFKGANPGELPIQQPTKFEFVVNLKTAKALGIELPLSILGFVSEYIE